MSTHFPIHAPWRLTADFEEPRPLYLPPTARHERHGGWDCGAPLGTALHAPENGPLIVHDVYRSGPDMTGDQYWPDGQWYAWSNYYADVYGCMVILLGRSGMTYLLAHQERLWIYRMLGMGSVKRKRKAYNKWVAAYLNLENPMEISEGAVIGHVGDEGSTAGVHLHLELHRGRTWGKIDPATVWPEMAKEKGSTT